MTEPPPNTSGRGLLLSYIRQADVSPVPAGCLPELVGGAKSDAGQLAQPLRVVAEAAA
jgi:hypothetical protein